MKLYWLLIGILVVWRGTHLLHREDGPWEILARFRRLMSHGSWAALLDCFYCLSLWTAIPLAYLLGESWKEKLLLWPALSAGSILLDELTSKPRVPPTPPAAPFFELPEDLYGLLRTKETASNGDIGGADK